MLAVIFRLGFFGPNIGPSPNVKKGFPQFNGGKFPIAIKLFVKLKSKRLQR
jgi:hypothetical protein